MRLAGTTILIVEDEPIIGLALEDVLIGCGASTVYADNLEDAFAALERAQLSAAVLDVNVHGKDSFDLAAALLDRRIPFIFATGYGDLPRPGQLGTVPAVAKPYAMGDIERALLDAMASGGDQIVG